MKSHLQSYPCPLQINSFWNLGFLLGITIILQIITGIFLGLHYTSDLNSAYSSLFFFIREIYYLLNLPRNYFVPIFQGSPEVVYPRVNNFSILILFISYLLLMLSLILEFGGGTGWTLYPPLSTSFMSLSPSSIILIIFGLLISGISSCLLLKVTKISGIQEPVQRQEVFSPP